MAETTAATTQLQQFAARLASPKLGDNVPRLIIGVIILLFRGEGDKLNCDNGMCSTISKIANANLEICLSDMISRCLPARKKTLWFSAAANIRQFPNFQLTWSSEICHNIGLFRSWRTEHRGEKISVQDALQWLGLIV